MLKRMEIATLHLDDANSIDALSRNIRLLTQAIGQTTRGDESLQLMYNTLAKLARGSKETAKDQWPYAAFIQPNGLTVGQGSLSDELLHYAGFRNAATLLGLRTYQRFPWRAYYAFDLIFLLCRLSTADIRHSLKSYCDIRRWLAQRYDMKFNRQH